jgi:hypothetical protein
VGNYSVFWDNFVLHKGEQIMEGIRLNAPSVESELRANEEGYREAVGDCILLINEAINAPQYPNDPWLNLVSLKSKLTNILKTSEGMK